MSGGRKPREKGIRFEREIVSILKEHGIRAKRVPLSGATSFQKGDIVIETVEGSPIIVEVKSRKSEFKRIYTLLEDAFNRGCEGVEIHFCRDEKTGFLAEPIVLLPLSKWISLMTNFNRYEQLQVQVYDTTERWLTLSKKLDSYIKNVDVIMIKDDRKSILVGVRLKNIYNVFERTLAIEGITVDIEKSEDEKKDEK